jgi:hypothetical protein
MRKKIFAEMRKALEDFNVQDVNTGVQLGLWKSNIAELSERGGMLEIEYKLEIDPDNRHTYVEPVYLHVNMDVETIDCLVKHIYIPSLPLSIRVRNTWTTPTINIEEYQDVCDIHNAKDFLDRLHWAVLRFAQNHHRRLITELIDASYFDATDWSSTIAANFNKIMRLAA